MLLTGAVEMNALAQASLQRFTQWPWIEQPAFQLRGGQSTTELSPPHRKLRRKCPGVWLLCSTVHLTFAIIEKSFQQEKLIKGVALIFIKKGDEP